jgi:hypothetical protein
MARSCFARAARLVGVTLAACAVFAGWTTVANAARPSVSVTSTPALFPAFDSGITDYVVRCTAGSPVQLQVRTGGDAKVRVDGGSERKGIFGAAVKINTGQEFKIQTKGGGGFGNTYHVRCLPSDFPQWTVSRPGSPQAQYYMMAPTFKLGGFTTFGHYIVLFTNHGVPVWWYSDDGNPADVKLLPNGHFLWTTLNPASIGTGGNESQEVTLNGTLVRTVNAGTVPPFNVANDFHDIQLLPNGNYLVLGGYQHPDVDLSFCPGGPADTTVYDDVIQELTPTGELVWQWDTLDHIPASEMDPQWCQAIVANGQAPYDIEHMNSIQEYGDEILVSFRHLDAIYDISRSTGQVIWKLGGTPRDPTLPGTQLTILNDPVFDCGSHFGGQHEARMLADGTVTFHDNGSALPDCNNPGVVRAPRAVRYSINLASGTATLVESVSDPAAAPRSDCCGSALRLGTAPNSDWVADWGFTNTTDELTPSGRIVFQLQWNGFFSYRTYPILPGLLPLPALRDGMNAQFPRP